MEIYQAQPSSTCACILLWFVHAVVSVYEAQVALLFIFLFEKSRSRLFPFAEANLSSPWGSRLWSSRV